MACGRWQVLCSDVKKTGCYDGDPVFDFNLNHQVV